MREEGRRIGFRRRRQDRRMRERGCASDSAEHAMSRAPGLVIVLMGRRRGRIGRSGAARLRHIHSRVMVMPGVRRMAGGGEQLCGEAVRADLKRERPTASRHEPRRNERSQGERNHRKGCEPSMTTQCGEPDGHAEAFFRRSSVHRSPVGGRPCATQISRWAYPFSESPGLRKGSSSLMHLLAGFTRMKPRQEIIPGPPPGDR